MIKVTIYENESHEWRGFKAQGHAGYDELGKDIVCAAASVLITNTMNAIEKFTDEETDVLIDESEDEPCIEFHFKKSPDHDAALLFDTMVFGLQSMEDNGEYESYIDIIFEEV